MDNQDTHSLDGAENVRTDTQSASTFTGMVLGLMVVVAVVSFGLGYWLGMGTTAVDDWDAQVEREQAEYEALKNNPTADDGAASASLEAELQRTGATLSEEELQVIPAQLR